MITIRRAAVLGAGTMGAQIAAHLANAGIPVLLLDLTANDARDGLARARALKPDPFFSLAVAALVSTGAFDADLSRVADCDWIIEAVLEDAAVKRDLLARVAAEAGNRAVISSNTSALSIDALASALPRERRPRFLGTHFFNPPRYLHLLELIPATDTDPELLRSMAQFADLRLGKGVVVARDTPGFIGNRLALFSVMPLLRLVQEGVCTIEEVDAITGPVLGRPKSATFRTLDLTGLDVAARVLRDLQARLGTPFAKDWFTLPPFVDAMLEQGLTGEKAGRGFYRREPNPDGASEIRVLDVSTLDYRARQAPVLTALSGAPRDTAERVRVLFGDTGRVGGIVRAALAPVLVYASRTAPDVAPSVDDIDRAFRWGFGWELGPFELIEAIGDEVLLRAAREICPELVADGAPLRTRNARLAPADPNLRVLRRARERSQVVRQAAGASLVDIGEGVLAVEFHAKMNTLGADAVAMLEAGVEEAQRRFAALVIGNEGEHFTAGADLRLVLECAQRQDWASIDAMARRLQQALLGLRYSGVPVVVATHGLALGGGCELALHGDRVQAAAESWLGLVETGVGLIPSGGGTKEMTARAANNRQPGETRLLRPIQRAFETIAFARVSTSALDARQVGLLREVDGVTMNHERLLGDARTLALRLVADGYQPPPRPRLVPVGGDEVLAPLKLGIHLAGRAGRISAHDARVGTALATVMAGGSGLPHPTAVSEDRLLELEREAFLGLVGEPLTQARIQHTLLTGKPLRN